MEKGERETTHSHGSLEAPRCVSLSSSPTLHHVKLGHPTKQACARVYFKTFTGQAFLLQKMSTAQSANPTPVPSAFLTRVVSYPVVKHGYETAVQYYTAAKEKNALIKKSLELAEVHFASKLSASRDETRFSSYVRATFVDLYYPRGQPTSGAERKQVMRAHSAAGGQVRLQPAG